jgi:sec-independent protein translocase protein TatB
MFGIGLPEMILILALALIVVGPDKLPDLARSLAKGVMELKKTAEALKKNLTEDGNPLDDIKPELDSTAQALKSNLLDTSDQSWKTLARPGEGVNPTPDKPEGEIIDAEVTVIDDSKSAITADQTDDKSDTGTSSAPSPSSEKDSTAPPAC